MFDFERTDDYDSDNYLDHADEFKPGFGTRLGRKVADLGLSVPDLSFGNDDDDDDETIGGEWHHAEYTVAPGEKPTLKVDGEEVGEIESFDWDYSRTPDEDDLADAARYPLGCTTISGSMTIEPNVCDNCGYEIGGLVYEMIGEEKERRTNYCSGCGKPVEEVLDL